jgi:hypothetical protein
MADYSGITRVETAQMTRSLRSLGDILKESKEQNTMNIVKVNAEGKAVTGNKRAITAENPNIGGNIDVTT